MYFLYNIPVLSFVIIYVSSLYITGMYFLIAERRKTENYAAFFNEDKQHYLFFTNRIDVIWF